MEERTNDDRNNHQISQNISPQKSPNPPNQLNLNLSNVMKILMNALNHIDVRLVNHGWRVAYIVYKMMQTDGSYRQQDMQEICMIAALHDIGAYKTEEIDNLFQFESESALDHSIYGYLFFKYMSPLRKWAEAVLYHHLPYKLHHYFFESKLLKIADILHLADRMDIKLRTHQPWNDMREIWKQQDVQFGKHTIELLYRANLRYDIENSIKTGSGFKELDELLSTADYSDETLLAFIRMIAFSIDFRSEVTVSHVATTASISIELGKLLGLKKEELKMIEWGAFLHDIGKISTPLEILEKPDGLTGEEMQIMRDHVDIARDILKGNIHEDVLHMVYCHHEKLDGSGYPLGLTAEHLTLSDRIVAVADQISALTGKRSYKESLPIDVVLEILKREKSGEKLCVSVIDSAIRHAKTIMESSNQNIKAIADMYDAINNEYQQISRDFDFWHADRSSKHII